MANHRIEVGVPTPLQTTWYTPGTEAPVDLNTTPTVGIVHVNGTVILAPGTATTHVGAAGSGMYQFTLPAQANPAALIITWSGNITPGGAGTAVTRVDYVDVLARQLCELAEIRALDSLSDTTAYPTTLLIAKRDAATDLFEQVVGVRSQHYGLDVMDGDSTYRRAYMPVESTWAYEPNLSRRLILSHKQPRAVLSVGFWNPVTLAYDLDLAPIAFTGTQAQYLAESYLLYPSGEIERALIGPGGSPGWPRGVRNVQIEYLYGTDDLPATLKDALLKYIRLLVLESTSRVSMRATQIANEGGTISLGAAQDWVRPTGIAEIDAVLGRYDERDIALA